MTAVFCALFWFAGIYRQLAEWWEIGTPGKELMMKRRIQGLVALVFHEVTLVADASSCSTSPCLFWLATFAQLVVREIWVDEWNR